MKTINLSFGITRARNPEHFQVHYDILAIITDEFATNFSISPLRDTYVRAFDVENDCYLRNTAYQNTPEVKAADQKRDDLFLYTSQTIMTATRSPIPITAEAGRRLQYLLTPYKNATRLNYAANTAAVTDFIQKMRDATHVVDIATLGLETAIDALDEANKTFNQIYTGRSNELLSRATAETMKNARIQVDDAFRTIASAINSLYEVNELVGKEAEKRATLGAVIDNVNAVILQLQTTLSRAGVGSKPNAKPDDKPDVDPGDGGDGDGGDDKPIIE